MKGPLHIEIDTQAVRENIKILKSKYEGIEIIAVLKELAYGHGMLNMAKICQEEGIDGIAVIMVKEGVYLRENGIELPIYLLGRASFSEIPTAIENKLIYPINAVEDVEKTKAYLESNPKARATVSLPINTGMNRYGFKKDGAVEICELIKRVDNMEIVQVYSHLTHADDQVDPYSREQFADFKKVLEALPISGYKRSIANSAASVRYDDMFLDQIRVGCLIHGLAPVDGEPLPKELPLKTTFSCRTEVNHIHLLKAGESTSYGRDYTADKDVYLGIIAGGYGCGIAKSLSNRGEVIINGRRYPMVGRVCMSQFMVNLGEKTDVKVGDVVTLIGKDGDESIDAFEHADWAERNFLEVMITLSVHNL